MDGVFGIAVGGVSGTVSGVGRTGAKRTTVVVRIVVVVVDVVIVVETVDEGMSSGVPSKVSESSYQVHGSKR